MTQLYPLEQRESSQATTEKIALAIREGKRFHIFIEGSYLISFFNEISTECYKKACPNTCKVLILGTDRRIK